MSPIRIAWRTMPSYYSGCADLHTPVANGQLTGFGSRRRSIVMSGLYAVGAASDGQASLRPGTIPWLWSAMSTLKLATLR